MTGDFIPPNRRLYLTPDAPPEGRFCRQLQIPDDPVWVGLVDGALSTLAEAGSWRESGALTPEETADAMLDMLEESWALTGCAAGGEIQTPFWDDVTDTDDEYPSETQPWYGYVTEPTDPADELTFVEQAGIWVFTGMLAVSGAVGAAILFNTLAPRFTLAMRGDDFIEVLRVIFDGEEQARVTTSGDPDTLYEIPVVGEDTGGAHTLMIVRES